MFELYGLYFGITIQVGYTDTVWNREVIQKQNWGPIFKKKLGKILSFA